MKRHSGLRAVRSRLFIVLPALAASLFLIFSSFGAAPGPAPRHSSKEPAKDHENSTSRLETTEKKKPRYQERLDDPYLAPGPPLEPLATTQSSISLGPYTSIQVNIDIAGVNIPGDAANEPSIAIDPTARNRIVIGWRQFDSVASNFRQAGVATSLDGGRTWTTSVIEPQVFRTDPVLESDLLGTFYYMSLTNDPNGVFVTDLFTSIDGGLTWSGPVPATGGDKQWMTMDNTGGPEDGNLYEFWTPEFSNFDPAQFTRSLDGGSTFDTPLELLGSSGERALIWGTMAAAADGRLYVAGFEDTTQLRVAVARIANPSAQPFIRTAIGIEYDQSGANFFMGRGATNWKVNPVGLAGQLWVAVSQATGRIYLASSVNADAFGDLDVHFARSIDDPTGNLVFQNAVRVNDDLAGNGADQWFTTMSVAPNGRIDLVWNDTRNNPGAPQCFPPDATCHSELFYSFSVDEGATWSPNVPLTPAWDSLIGWPNQSKIGDYYHMVSDNLGAHLAFAATFNGEQDIYYMRIGDYDCNANDIGDSADLTAGTSPDCNSNGIPDECDWASGALPATEVCDGADNDCDGTTDAEFGVGSTCNGAGECGMGLLECATPSTTLCSTDPGGSGDESVAEICGDALDNDCNGMIDDGYSLGDACEGLGECGPGLTECSGLFTTQCSTDPGGTGDESTVDICDGLDNSCDGLVDGGDLDLDGRSNACDCNDSDPNSLSIPLEIDGLDVTVDPNGYRFEWNDQWPVAGSSTIYDITSGNPADLIPTGDFSTTSCHFDDLGDGAGIPVHHFEFSGPYPPPGEGLIFMIRGQNQCPFGTGTFGSPDRDLGAAGSANPCLSHEVCDDLLDNDGDGLFDCLDDDCNGVAGC